MQWMVVGLLDGTFLAPDGKHFDNAQVIARVHTGPGESVWEALDRQAESGDGYITELMKYREKGRWEYIIAYELTGVRLEHDYPKDEPDT